MLPMQATLATQSDILPTQNIGLLDQSQPQIYSLLASSNSPTSTKQPRRKKATKLDETIPVMINPRITRTPTGVSFVAPHRSTVLSESIPPFVSAGLMNDHTLPFRLFFEHDSYDANNNINNSQSPSLSMSLNPSFTAQAQQIPTWSNESFPVVNGNSMMQSAIKRQLFGSNRLLNNNINERTVSVSSPQENEYKHLNSSFMFTDQRSLFSHSHPLPSPLSSIFASNVPSIKPKRKYSKRLRSPAPVEQHQPVQQISPCPTTFTQPTVSSGLPSIIPASVTLAPTKSEDHSFTIDIPTVSNFAPLTPPSSINSIKSPPTNIINEPSSMPFQQHLLPYTTTNTAKVKPIPNQCCPDQRFSHTQKTIYDSSISSLPLNLQHLLATAHSQYGMVPSGLMPTNILPMACSPPLSGSITNTPSMSIPTDMKKERKKREKCARESKVVQKPTIEILRNERSSTSKSLTTNICAMKKRKHKIANTKDIRTKKQLRRITRQNRLAVLKFMMRKRKEQKQQQPVSDTKLSDVKVEEVIPKRDKIETNLPYIIAPSLKISLSATQKIESISLYYHRRRKPESMNENFPRPLTIADNKLGLLLEAVDFIETLRDSSKLAPPSNK